MRAVVIRLQAKGANTMYVPHYLGKCLTHDTYGGTYIYMYKYCSASGSVFYGTSLSGILLRGIHGTRNSNILFSVFGMVCGW